MNDLHLKLLALFQGECRDHLSAVRSALDALEANDWDRRETNFTEMHRRVHSLKGAARAVDLKQIERLAHALESIVERFDQKQVPVDAGTVRVVRDALDAIEDHAQSVEQGVPVDIPDDTRSKVEALLVPGADQDPGLVPGASLGIGMDDGPGDAAVDWAPEPVRDPGAEAATGDAGIGNPASRKKPATVPSESIRVGIDVLDGLLSWSGDFLALTSTQSILAENFRRLEQEIVGVRQGLDVLRGDAVGDSRQGGVPGVTDVLATVDSGLRTLATRVQALKREQLELGWRARSMARQLDTHVKRARMVQIESVLGNLRKVVRDIAQEQGKTVHVETRGLDLVADRWVVQVLKDPIIHLLRNSVCHGVETAAERKAAGKPIEATVRVAVDQERDTLTVVVEDDGRGIDSAMVAARARQLGLGDIDENDVQAVTTILTAARFSTAPEVNELAGRGLGLSVVREAVHRLGGELNIDSVLGKGTRFGLRLPVSISSQPLLTVHVGEECYAMPARSVEQVLRFDLASIQSIEGRDVLVMGEDVPLPVMTLAAVLERETPAVFENGGKAVAVKLKTLAGRGALIVDGIAGVREGLVRDLGPAAAGADVVSGGFVLETGAVVPVLSAARLVDSIFSRPAELRIVTTDSRPRLQRILVVDDSITTRTLEKSILEANGYDVRLSVDGADALDLLRREEIDLIVSDVEMPRMDGFDLVRAVKNDTDLSRIPIVLVTSRDDEEDRRKGLRLGAEAYVVKQTFNQTALLETIGQLL